MDKYKYVVSYFILWSILLGEKKMQTINMNMITDQIMNAPLDLRNVGLTETQIEEFIVGKIVPVERLLKKGSEELTSVMGNCKAPFFRATD